MHLWTLRNNSEVDGEWYTRLFSICKDILPKCHDLIKTKSSYRLPILS
jgi:hypothetical protein